MRTAEVLGVHRRTLVHRLARVERLTGCTPTSTSGIAELWTALEAARALDPITSPGGR
ncbi:helix-turn-helix domain-containing protein [Saccharopolyspora sp. NPDC047091]|uniref:helix-turn-helix domain-containing protein n=1 Tax=Saccharopolyspora sp. NPDC047091 TaxID=3155924 RepID=UPI0033FD4858